MRSLIAVLAVAASGCVINVDADQVVVREEKRLSAGPGADLTLETFDGSISVESWDQDDILVEIEKRGPDREIAAALGVRTTQDGSRVRVEAPAPKTSREFIGFGSYSGPSVSFVVRVPEQLTLTAITRDGSIAVTGVGGVVSLRSGDGSIRAKGVRGTLTARTGDGALTVEDVDGRVSLDSGDGSIRLHGRLEAVRAETSDGSITIEASAGSAMKESWDISTRDGSIALRIPRDFDAEIDAASRDGRVRSDFDGLRATHDEDDRGTLRGRLGSGGHTVTLRSGDGSIAVSGR